MYHFSTLFVVFVYCSMAYHVYTFMVTQTEEGKVASEGWASSGHADPQWNLIMTQVPTLLILFTLYLLVRTAVRWTATTKRTTLATNAVPTPHRANAVAVLVGSAAVLYYHGQDVLLLVTAAALVYAQVAAVFVWDRLHGTAGPRDRGWWRLLPLLSLWATVLGAWLFISFPRGVSFATAWEGHGSLPAREGLLPLSTYFKLTVLRLISYGADALASRDAVAEDDAVRAVEEGRPAPTGPSATAAPVPAEAVPMCTSVHSLTTQRSLTVRRARARSAIVHEEEVYLSPLWFWLYLVYPPLYIAGPIISFNDFVSQASGRHALPWSSLVRRAMQGLATVVVACTACEWLVHAVPHVSYAIRGTWRVDSLMPSNHVGIAAYLLLNFMYLKFLVIWRFFWSVAALDGIETVDNMPRCVNNNCTFRGFWRSWHASFNVWLFRYIYHPLGGRRSQFVSIWLVFGFVGLWHELQGRWLAWALLNAVFFCIEAVLTTTVSWWRESNPVVSALTIWALIAANTSIVFGGFDGTWVFMTRLLDAPLFMAVGTAWFAFGSQLMTPVRGWSTKPPPSTPPFAATSSSTLA